jgi:ABC-type phosphate/phosphonate transport system substrate-binding protein
VAVTKGWENYRASFMVRADAPYKTLTDLRGMKLGAPDEDSITSWIVRATLREALGGNGRMALLALGTWLGL